MVPVVDNTAVPGNTPHKSWDENANTPSLSPASTHSRTHSSPAVSYTHIADDDDDSGSEAGYAPQPAADAGFIILRPDASGASLRVAAASATSFTAALGALRTRVVRTSIRVPDRRGRS